MTLAVDWRAWAAEHPVKAARLLIGLDEALATCDEMPDDDRAVLVAKRDLIHAGLRDGASTRMRLRQAAHATAIRVRSA